jgi:formylglycine-generating enzyme required for sulfatase activity
MKKIPALFAALVIVTAAAAHAGIAPAELVAPKFEISGGYLYFTVQSSVSGRNYQLQYSDTMASGSWQDLGVLRSGDGGDLVVITEDVPGGGRFYRILLAEAPAAPTGFSLIPAGSFQMGNALDASGDGNSDEVPVHGVNVGTYYMAKHEVTKALWDEVRTWGASHGYADLAVGSMYRATNYSKGPTHPVYYITWHDMVKWCNARSEMENLTPCYYTDTAQTVESIYKTATHSINNTMVKWSANGYRLPTEAEWEKAARGGLGDKRFPWGDSITHSQANFWNGGGESYQSGPGGGHPIWSNDGNQPYTSPVGSFAANGYGLYDMAGNVWEWCWDWYGNYTSGLQDNPHGLDTGDARVFRGGSWNLNSNAYHTRCSFRGNYFPDSAFSYTGFRLVRAQP